ncbi:hypothetical protein C8R47DRAFT_1169216, partial [Mycena vitilis]
MNVETASLVLVKLERCQDAQMCREALTAAEGLKMELGSVYPWPTVLSQLLQALQVQRRYIQDNNERAGYTSRLADLERDWDRLRVASVGFQWSKLFPHGLQMPASMPAELLGEIMSKHVADTHAGAAKSWAEHADFLCNCAVVARKWNSVGTELLYRGCIRLSRTRSIQKLLDTISSSESPRHTIHHLVLNHVDKEPSFGHAVTQLVARCSTLRVFQLRARCDFLETPTNLFHDLASVDLQRVTLQHFAPFLASLPNLSILHLRELRIFSGRQQAFRSGSEPPGDNLTDFPVPTYRLKELHLTSTMLTGGQLRWVLGGSESLEFVSLRGVYAPSLTQTIGASVRSLRLTPGGFPLARNDDHLAATVPMFTYLDSLQIIGAGWPWMALLTGITSILTKISILRSTDTIHALITVLKDASWQPQLNNISLFIGDVGPESDANIGSDEVEGPVIELRSLCTVRKIALHSVASPGLLAPFVELGYL